MSILISVLGPINASTFLRINTKPEIDETNFSVPKVKLELNLESLQVSEYGFDTIA